MTARSNNDGAAQPPVSLHSFLRSEGEMAQRIAQYPWADHALGPLDAWPPSLKTAVSLILNSRHPMWIGWGRERSFLYNDAYVHVLGLAKHPWALGRPAREVWAEIWDVVGPMADKVFGNGEATFVDDMRLLMSRGDRLEETFYSFSYSPIRDERGDVAGLFCPSNDVTAKVVGARRSRTLSELVANALVQKSTVEARASVEATLAKNPDDGPFALLHLADGEPDALQEAIGIEALETVAGVLRTGVADRVVLSRAAPLAVNPDGRPVLEAVVLPVAGRAEARPLGALIAGISPTRPFDEEYRAFFELMASNVGTAIQNARAAEEEKKRIDMMAEMDRAKTAFFSNVSHEFRTPLTLMLGPLEQLSKTQDERERRLAATARRNALRLLKLVNTLLEFSRLEAGRSDAAFAAIDLGAITRDVASSFRSAIESAGLRLTIDAELDEPVYVDGSMWERILLNLLSNALKFTFEGGITVSLRRSGDAAELRVEDTGTGIAAEDLPHLFERFHRVRGAKSRSHEGSGIGLALVRDLVALHGGTVDAQSAPGAGTTFRVRIPFGSAHLDPAKIVSLEMAPYASAIEQYLADADATLARGERPATTSVPPGSGRARILLADDNADLREYVSSILCARYDVTAVGNGREALAALQAEPFDLVVSDVMMPEMDGLELLQAVRADSRIATTPFIVLSARAGEEASLEGLLEGADDYVVKPFAAEELLARVYAQMNAAAIRVRATSELRASEERFRTLAASLPHIVFETDAIGAVRFLSDEYTAYTGLPAESGLGLDWTSVIHADDLGETTRKWNEAIASTSAFSEHFRLRRADGAFRWFVARALPQRGPDGAVLRWIGTITDAHDQRIAARERELLARASDIFSQPLDLDATLDAIARFTVPELADWCQIDLRTEQGIKTVAIAHRDPEKDRVARCFVGRVHLNPEGLHGSPYVIRTGRSQLIRLVPPEIVKPTVGDDEETRMYFELGLHSLAAVPLAAEGETLGMLGVIYGESQRQYADDDLPLLEELGRRAGLAIRKARLFERERRAAERFQEASLPVLLPNAPGLVLDAYYAPGRAEAQVGGDWYDALRLVDGRVVVSIGDVAGSGLEAAVTMGNMRQIIRGIAQVHADPALMLDAADRALRLEHPDTFATAFVGVFDAISGTFTYASAGQTPPLLRRPDGEIVTLGETGLPLGLRANVQRTGSTTTDVAPGSCLLLYTDGLTEFDRLPVEGERRLREEFGAIAEHADEHPARWIVERLMNDAEARDDVAVLVLTFREPAERDGFGRALLERWSFETADGGAASGARHAFTRSLAERGAAPDDVAVAEMVFGELIGNTVRYAPGPIEVIADWSGPDPVLHVLDSGPGLRHISILPPDLLSESGRGLFIVSALTHDFRVSTRGAGGSHARAVLRTQGRQLVPSGDGVFSGTPLFSLGERIGIVD
jgi:PAS domain S-box-containing protein